MTSQLVVGRLEHVRPEGADRAHSFRYPWFGVLVRYPIKPMGRWFTHNRFGFLSFDDRDHGDRNGSDPLQWLQRELERCEVPLRVDDLAVEVLTMPRVFGRVFNPVSFWYLSRGDQLLCVVAEVNNTFEGTHPYVLYQGGKALNPQAWLEMPKVFYVSPFFPVTGFYRFRFQHDSEQTDVRLHFVDANKQLQIATRVGGSRLTMNPTAIVKASVRAIMGVWLALVRIHWHALILYLKGVRLVPRDRGHGRPIKTSKRSRMESDL